ncbi:MAG: hypothetical protein AAGA24_06830 [Pseudomonadota bacterium]
MDEGQRAPNVKRLRMVALSAAFTALLGGLAFWLQIEAGGGMGWVGWLIIATLTMIIYGISFFVGVRAFENTLEQFIVSDTFKKKNKWIDVETETRISQDRQTDMWVKHYVFARTMLAMGILPLLACIYLFWIL